jgi:hypothetical protein
VFIFSCNGGNLYYQQLYAFNGVNVLAVKQIGFSGTIAQEHSVAGWNMILNKIKEILEKE